jgi:hypothetical protein
VKVLKLQCKKERQKESRKKDERKEDSSMIHFLFNDTFSTALVMWHQMLG